MTSLKVETVLGPVDPSSLGRTLTHEHLSLKADFLGLPGAGDDEMKNCPFVLENYSWICQHPYSHADNINIRDQVSRKLIIEEMKQFKLNGGGTVVENSTYGLDRDIEFLKQVSVETGIHVVAGTGYYVSNLQDKETLTKPTEELYLQMRKDLLDGVGKTGIKCGVLGELGCSWPLHQFERNVLKAAGQLQNELKCPVIIHPGRNKEAPEEIIRILQEAGGIVSKTVMSHLERTIFEQSEMSEFASLGTYCEFDLFGIECSYYQFNDDVDMPSDAQRISMLRCLVKEGYGDRIVIAHDIHSKHRLKGYGGHGYSHILLYAAPKMLKRGLTKEDVERILITNPKTWLSF